MIKMNALSFFIYMAFFCCGSTVFAEPSSPWSSDIRRLRLYLSDANGTTRVQQQIYEHWRNKLARFEEYEASYSANHCSEGSCAPKRRYSTASCSSCVNGSPNGQSVGPTTIKNQNGAIFTAWKSKGNWYCRALKSGTAYCFQEGSGTWSILDPNKGEQPEIPEANQEAISQGQIVDGAYTCGECHGSYYHYSYPYLYKGDRYDVSTSYGNLGECRRKRDYDMQCTDGPR